MLLLSRRSASSAYIIAAAAQTEKAIAAELKKAGKISLAWDGWTCDGTNTHYIGIFALYAKDGKAKQVLLALQPTLDEDDLGADAHIGLSNSTLEVCI
jgi:hypothetical protein